MEVLQWLCFAKPERPANAWAESLTAFLRSDPYAEPLFTNRDPFLDQAGPWKVSQECGGEDSALRRQLNPDDLGERWVSLQRYHCY
jgi:hypothetical protein